MPWEGYGGAIRGTRDGVALSGPCDRRRFAVCFDATFVDKHEIHLQIASLLFHPIGLFLSVGCRLPQMDGSHWSQMDWSQHEEEAEWSKREAEEKQGFFLWVTNYCTFRCVLKLFPKFAMHFGLFVMFAAILPFFPVECISKVGLVKCNKYECTNAYNMHCTRKLYEARWSDLHKFCYCMAIIHESHI